MAMADVQSRSLPSLLSVLCYELDVVFQSRRSRRPDDGSLDQKNQK